MDSVWKCRSTIAAGRLMPAFLATLLTCPAIAQRTHSTSSTAQDNFAAVRAYINKTITEKQLPSVSVAVAKDGKIIWEEAFGWADREKMIPATPGTVYALASLTKPYTSTGVMELVEQRKIDLDRPINEYLGSAPLTAIVGDASGATVRRVLCHTSGLPIHSVNLLGNGDQVPPKADTIRRYGTLVNPPGQYLAVIPSAAGQPNKSTRPFSPPFSFPPKPTASTSSATICASSRGTDCSNAMALTTPTDSPPKVLRSRSCFCSSTNASAAPWPTAVFTTLPTQLTHPKANSKPPITKPTKPFRTSSTYSLPPDVTPKSQASNVEVFLLKIFDPRI